MASFRSFIGPYVTGYSLFGQPAWVSSGTLAFAYTLPPFRARGWIFTSSLSTMLVTLPALRFATAGMTNLVVWIPVLHSAAVGMTKLVVWIPALRSAAAGMTNLVVGLIIPGTRTHSVLLRT